MKKCKAYCRLERKKERRTRRRKERKKERKKKKDYLSAKIEQVFYFLSSLFEDGLRYSAISSARSALSTIVFINGKPAGTHAFVIILL